jgi:hydrogenase maturation protease
MIERALVVGMGNPLRGDDGAGREVARRLREKDLLNVRVVETEGEATALLSLMEGSHVLYLIDACVSGARKESYHRIDLAKQDLPPAFNLSSHGFGLAEAVALARTLGRLPDHCVVYAIEGERFDIGATLSEAVSRAIDAVVAALSQEIEMRR